MLKSLLSLLIAATAMGQLARPSAANQTADKAPSTMVVGIEYGFDGIAAFFTNLHIPAAKLLPEKFDWAKMQPDITKPVNWALSDDLVREYQDAGFREIILALRTQSHDSDNGATYGKDRPIPRPEYEGLYAAWVRGMVERYDKDGVGDMPGLRYPVRYYEIEVELSSYTPEPVDDYLKQLSIAYRTAHEAYPNVIVAHTAFLPMTAFDTNPGVGQYEQAFADMRIPDKTHTLADIRKILDHPELFDRVNFHALEDPIMIERAVTWLHYEMAQRGYVKPIIISDTSATPFISYGNAIACQGAFLGIMVWPALESDRCRVADYFNRILDQDAATIAWKNQYLAADTVKRVVAAADQGIELIDTSFFTDLPILNSRLGLAGAGNAGFSGFVTETYNIFTMKHVVTEYRPAYYATKQIGDIFSGTFSISRETTDSDVRLYKISNAQGVRWIGWVNPDHLLLPGDAEPQRRVSLPFAFGATVTRMAQTSADPEKTSVPSSGGQVAVNLTTIPVFIESAAAESPPPIIHSNGGIGAVNGASFLPPIASGSWVTIFGQNLAPIPPPGRTWRNSEIVDGRLPTSLEGVSVRFDGKLGYPYFVGPGQLNVLAPDDLPTGIIPVDVATPSGIARTNADVRSVAPALFQIPAGQTGVVYAAAVHQDGATVAPPLIIPGARPARPGEVISVFGTGFGRTSPPRPAGELFDPAPLAAPYTVRIDGAPVSSDFGGIVGPGLYQFNLTMPEAGGPLVSVDVEVRGQRTGSGTVLAVER